MAEALKATKLIFITTQDGLIRDGELIRQMIYSDLDAIIATNKEAFGTEMSSKAVHASLACKVGIPRVHIINGRIDESLITEVFQTKVLGHSFTQTNISKLGAR